jgi:glycosyltransferase involved in cell wall biosynthesis
MAEPVWFWQRMVSPHMAGLAEALASSRPVTYVAEQPMCPERLSQGWHSPQMRCAQLRLAPTADAMRRLVHEAPADSIHLCEGLRGNGLVGVAARALAARGLPRWSIMETVDDRGWTGPLKRLAYRQLVRRRSCPFDGVLAIGHSTPGWLVARGMAADKVYPFAYFLPDMPAAAKPHAEPAPFRFLFVGRLVALKGVDLLIETLAELDGPRFQLWLAGSGPCEAQLRSRASDRLRGQVRWLGQRPIGDIPDLMAEADCLVLPSRYDGWGAVVSEALMAGTPAICSSRCGVAQVVRASGTGGVFEAGDARALAACLSQALQRGRQTPERRAALAGWARCLGAQSGARYLDAILSHASGAGPRPVAPWQAARRA